MRPAPGSPWSQTKCATWRSAARPPTASRSRWPSQLRKLSDRITLSLVRQAVDASLAGELLLPAVVPAPPVVATPRLEYAQVQNSRLTDTADLSMVAVAQRMVMAPDLQAGDVLYTVQPGDNLSRIAQRFYGDPAAFKQIVAANLAREQPGGQTLRDARFIYPGWQLVIPAPTRTVHSDANGQRWYTVRAGDTLSGISAQLLGDAQRYPELFADNQGAELGDGHVLTNPNLIWPGLHLRLPLEPAPDEVAEPAPQVPSVVPVTPVAPVSQSEPDSSTPAPNSEDSNSHAGSATDVGRNASDVSASLAAEPVPTVAPPTQTQEMPVRTTPGEQAPSSWPPLSLPGDAGADLGIAGGLTAAALLALHARRRRRTPPEPESDTRLDVHAFTLAEPAAVAASRLRGETDDPHGVVLGELLAGELFATRALQNSPTCTSSP